MLNIFVKNAKEKIEVVVKESINDREDLFLIDVIVKGNVGTTKVVVILDGDKGVAIEDCVSVSRNLASYLEEEEIFDDKYTIEVTSAGLEHPITLPRQYTKNIGRNIKVIKTDQSVLEGKLISAEGDVITLEVMKDKKKKISEQVDLTFSDIEKTNVLVSFK